MTIILELLMLGGHKYLNLGLFTEHELTGSTVATGSQVAG